MSQQKKAINTPRRGKSKAGSSQPLTQSSPPENIFNVSSPVTNFQTHMQQMPMYSPGYQIHPQLGFHQYQHTGFHQYQQGSFQHLMSQEKYPADVDEDDEDEDEDEAQEVEEVPETQVEQMPKSTKGTTKKFGKRAKAKLWTVEEEVALANAWITVSEDCVTGNSQRRDTFFVRVTKHYNALCSYERKKDQTYSKWHDMKAKMMKFNGIYNQERSQYRSGYSEDDYIQRAHTRYRNENNNKMFTNEAAWKVVKDHPQWVALPEFQKDADLNPRPSKRSKSTSEQYTTSSDARCRFDLNEASNEDDYEVHVQEPQRPTGRDKAKRAASTTSENTVSGLRGFVEQINIQNDKLLSVEANIARSMSEKVEIMRQREERKREEKKQKDLEFFISSHDHLEGAQKNAVLKQKEFLPQKYNW